MHIIIVGGGGVGYQLAQHLSENNQDIVVIEKTEEKARRFRESLDVMVLETNGASAATLEMAGIKNADMLIAVTDLDEVNIIACILANQYGVPQIVCRIRNPEHMDDNFGISPKKLGISAVINPEQVAATEISKMLHFPDASEVEYFTQGKVLMVGVTVGEEAEITGVPLHQLPMNNTESIIVGISKPGGKFIIPDGNDIIEPGSKIYLIGKSQALKDISMLLHHEKTRINQVTILGGGMVGRQLALQLESSRQPFRVKLIEKDAKRCEELSRELKDTLILHGDVTEYAMLKEEDMESSDAVVATAGDDRNNIVSALLAQRFGVKKIICEVKKPQYVSVYNTLGIHCLINPRMLAAAQILRLTKQEEVVALSMVQGEKAEVLEVVLPETARAAYEKIKDLHLPRGMMIGSIVRNSDVLVPDGDTLLYPGDHLIIFSLPKTAHKLGRYFTNVKL
ncbi:MAG: Trk system potassium transporter TrkA [Bacillota bacterium]|nr:Trk system potassium transporter TrkA [Bacillota bacterium]